MGVATANRLFPENDKSLLPYKYKLIMPYCYKQLMLYVYNHIMLFKYKQMMLTGEGAQTNYHYINMLATKNFVEMTSPLFAARDSRTSQKACRNLWFSAHRHALAIFLFSTGRGAESVPRY